MLLEMVKLLPNAISYVGWLRRLLDLDAQFLHFKMIREPSAGSTQPKSESGVDNGSLQGAARPQECDSPWTSTSKSAALLNAQYERLCTEFNTVCSLLCMIQSNNSSRLVAKACVLP